MLIAGVDLETTGLKQEEGHRIIEIGLSAWKYDGTPRRVGSTKVIRINPMRSIDAGAQAVHGISMSDLKGCPEWREVAPSIASTLAKFDLIVAHNAAFDGPFLGLELARIGLPVPQSEMFCTMENGRGATAMGKLPSLRELCWAFGVPYDETKAHAADYDIDVTMDCFWLGVSQGFYQVQKLTDIKRNAA